MIIIDTKEFNLEPYESETEFEETVLSLKYSIFGRNRIYFDLKKRIGDQGRVQNIPDGYLLDFSSKITPKLFVVENELAIHGLKHIAVQLLEFSISYDSSRQKIKTILRDAIIKDTERKNIVEKYIEENNFQNIDYLLDKTLEIQKKSDINVIVIIDQVDDDLEMALKEKFKFPIEIITIERYKCENKYCYYFEPFIKDFISVNTIKPTDKVPLDIDSVDTIVVPAQEDGFKDVFISENRWHEIRINLLMIPKIKYIAAYQVAPISAITHYAEVDSIEQWENGNKYVVNFKDKAKNIGPISLVQKGKVKALQSIRYTSLYALKNASNLDELWS